MQVFNTVLDFNVFSCIFTVAMMKDQDKTKDQLLSELKNLQKELAAATAFYENEIAGFREAEQTLRLMQFSIEHMADAVLWLNADGRIEYCNKASCNLLGYETDKLVGLSIDEVAAGYQMSYWNLHWESLRRSGSMRFESTYKTLAGNLVPVEIIANFMVYGAREFNCAFIRDISERRQAEQEILDSEARYHDLYEHAPDMYLSVDPATGTIIQCNQTTAVKTGYGKSELIGRPVIEMYHPDCRELALHAFEEFKISGQMNNMEFQICRKDGSLLDVSLNVTAVRDKKGNIVASRSSWRDITENKLAKEELRNSEARFRSYFELPLTGRAISSPLGSWLEVNTTLAGMLGYSKGELKGKTWFELTHPADLEKELVQYKRVLYDEIDGYNLEKRFVRKDGGIVSTHLEIQCLRKNDRSVDYFISLVFDISERIKAEAEIRQKNEELVRLVAEKDKFFSIIAHDLRSPFNSFLGFTQLMDEDLGTMRFDEIQKIAVILRKSAINLYNLLENLLTWSRIERGVTGFDPCLIPLKQKILESLPSVLETARKKGIIISDDIPENITVFADDNMLHGIIRNLSYNAVKFTHAGGTINISAKPSGGSFIEVSIKDSGIGMSMEMINKLFRIDNQTSRRGTEGEPSSGLGLIICKDFIERNGGRIWVHSEEGKGSTFSFTIPSQDTPGLPWRQSSAGDAPIV